MTITIKRSTVVAAIALIGVLGGLALGQVTQAISAGQGQTDASASYVSPLERTLKEVNRNIKAIKAAIGGPSLFGDTAIDYLDDVRGNTYGTCQELGGSAYCHN